MPGALDDLEYRQTALLAPGPGQVELEVVAAGLNFLDVMTALGQVPPLEDADGYRFGAECSEWSPASAQASQVCSPVTRSWP